MYLQTKIERKERAKEKNQKREKRKREKREKEVKTSSLRSIKTLKSGMTSVLCLPTSASPYVRFEEEADGVLSDST